MAAPSFDLVVCADVIHPMTDAPGSASGAAVTAIGIRDGRIAALGAREELVPGAARVHDIGAGCVTPGLVDAHIHPIIGLDFSRGVDLRHVTTGADLASELAAYAAASHEEWVLGWGLDPRFIVGRNIAAADLDAGVADRPVFVRLFDGHSAVVNTAGIAAAGITGAETFESSARVDLHPDGSPTGFLIEWQAMDLATAAVPPRPLAERADGMLAVLTAMADAGLTGGQVMDYTPGMFDVLEEAEGRGDLPIRLFVSPWIQAGDTEERVEEVIAAQGRRGRRWVVDGVKLMIDGTIDNGSAWLGWPDVNGQSTQPLFLDPQQYTGILHRLSGLGIRTATHAIGDAGIRHVLRSIGSAPDGRGRHRIEHIEAGPDDVLDLFVTHDVAASMQPTHCTLFCSADASDNWSRRLGDERVTWGWRLGSLHARGVPIALGSDWPIAPFEPLPIMADAQLRRVAGQPEQAPMLPGEAISAYGALAGYTSVRADTWGDTERGRISVGSVADLTLLSGDVLAVDPDELPSVRVLGTIVDGVLRQP